MYHEVNSTAGKDQFVMGLTQQVLDPSFTTDTVQSVQDFLRNLVGFYVIMEGIFFYSGFVSILSFHRQNRMTGIGEQFQYILRDETIHMNFGVDLINTIKEKTPNVLTPGLQADLIKMIKQAVEYEVAYAQNCLPTGVLGLNAGLFREYIQYVDDRRLNRIGLWPQYGSKNSFPWMSSTMELAKEKNFFESRVTEYQSSANLKWE